MARFVFWGIVTVVMVVGGMIRQHGIDQARESMLATGRYEDAGLEISDSDCIDRGGRLDDAANACILPSPTPTPSGPTQPKLGQCGSSSDLGIVLIDCTSASADRIVVWTFIPSSSLTARAAARQECPPDAYVWTENTPYITCWGTR